MPIFNVDVTADPHRPRIVGPDHAPVPAINDFLSYLEQCARSPYTVRAYARGLAHFAGWLYEAGVDLDAVTRPVIGQYIGAFGRGSRLNASLIDRPSANEGRQARTVNHRLSVLASYFAFRIRHDTDRGVGPWHQHSNPVSTPDDEMVSHRLTGRDQPVRERRREFRRRVPRRLPARLDPLLVERLITAAVSWRDKAILTLLSRTGQRIGDWSDIDGRHGLLGMALSDVDERQQTITVRLKGARQDHRVPVTDDFWPLSGTRGQDGLDVALCRLGILTRTPQRGTSRRSRRPRRTVAELVAMADVPPPFSALTLLYLDTYATRVSHVYVTLRHKLIALGHFWRFLAEQYPEIATAADVLPAHGRAYIPYAIERARHRQRGDHAGSELRPTAHVWLLEVRTFFADICTWATEPDSPFAPHAPRVVPLTRRDLVGIGFEQARARTQARITATILDLEREMPAIRACALQQWKAATEALSLKAGDRRTVAAEAATFCGVYRQLQLAGHGHASLRPADG